jgi:hypothetical protein
MISTYISMANIVVIPGDVDLRPLFAATKILDLSASAKSQHDTQAANAKRKRGRERRLIR